MTEYAEGTVAVATVRGVEGVRVMPRMAGDGVPDGWVSSQRIENSVIHYGDDVTDIRPLVVLDLKAANPHGVPSIVLESLLSTLRNSEYLGCEGVADQIEAQTKPKLEEPGLYGVVEASANANRDRETWTRVRHGWTNGYFVHSWKGLVDPVLVREGVDG